MEIGLLMSNKVLLRNVPTNHIRCTCMFYMLTEPFLPHELSFISSQRDNQLRLLLMVINR